jgi:hypothetical protein
VSAPQPHRAVWHARRPPLVGWLSGVIHTRIDTIGHRERGRSVGQPLNRTSGVLLDGVHFLPAVLRRVRCFIFRQRGWTGSEEGTLVSVWITFLSWQWRRLHWCTGREPAATPVRPGAAGRPSLAASCKSKGGLLFFILGPAPAEIQSRRRLRGAAPCRHVRGWAATNRSGKVPSGQWSASRMAGRLGSGTEPVASTVEADRTGAGDKHFLSFSLPAFSVLAPHSPTF